MINKKQYIDRYNKKYMQIIPECRKDYGIDNEYIYHTWIKEKLKYKISDIVDLLNFYYDFREYIYKLKKSDIIKIYCYGNISNVNITGIIYKRKLDNKGNKIISSIKYKEKLQNGNEYKSKTKIQNIIYKDIQYEKLFDVCLHFYNYLFFSEYEIQYANEILKKIRGLK